MTQTALDATSVGAARGPMDSAESGAAHELHEQLDSLNEHVRQHVQHCREQIRTTVLDPFDHTMREVAESHRQLVQQASLAGGEVGDKELWRRVVAYRDGVRTQVIDVLRERLTKRNLGHALSQAWLDALRDLSNLGSAVDIDVQLPEDPALFASEAGDSSWRRMRKLDVRVRRRMQRLPRAVGDGMRKLVRRAPREPRVRTRSVPARAIVDYHLQVRMPSLLRPMHDDQQQAVARHVARFEDAVTQWTYDILEAEAALDRPGFHRPESLVSDVPLTQSETPDSDADDDSEPPARPPLETIASALQEALDTVSAGKFEVGVDEEPMSAAQAALALDMSRGGTFLLDLGNRRLPAAAKSAAMRIQERQARWSAWHHQVVNRLELNRRLIGFRQELRNVEESFVQRITKATIEPVDTSFRDIKDRLRAAQDETEQACNAADAAGSQATLGRSLRRIQSSMLRQLQSAWRELPGLVSSDQALSTPGSQEWQTIGELIDGLPDALPVHTRQPDDDEEVVPGKRVIELDLREIAQDAMSLPLPDQLVDEAAALKKRVIEVWTATEKVQDIVRYNLGAALDELEAASTPADATPPESEDSEATSDTTPVGAARQLIVDGLRRSADTLTELEQSLWPPWQALADAAFEQLHDDWLALHKRISAEAAIEERWVGFQTRVARRAESAWQVLEDRWQQLQRQAGRAVSVGTRRVKRLIERGQEAVGVSEAGEDEAAATLDAIAEINALRRKLPLVYRRLFSPDPLTEPSLFEGRSRDLVRVRQHFARWRKGRQAGVLIFRAPLGGGRTTLLNILATTVFDECEVHRLDLSKRIPDTTAFATQIGAALQLDLPSETTLDDVETQLLSRKRPKRPDVCLIDNLEHCLLAAPGGMDLIEHILIFLSRTDATVYWVATVGDLAWTFVQKTAPATAGLASEVSLPPLDGAALEELILNRHGRSGMPLSFAMPSNPSALLRQRMRRAKTSEKKQALLKEMYFDSLSKVSGGSILLALFYWLRSADFAAEDDVLTVKPVRPLGFRFLSTLDLTRSFTLKAFLIHNTLTQDEHARVLRLPDDESVFVLESLLNQRIIESASSSHDGAGGSARVEPSGRYQIRPLMIHPVTEHLRSRNIIY